MADLRRKLGAPTTLVYDHLQNGFGVKFIGVRASWIHLGWVVTFDSTESNLEWGLIQAKTAKFIEIQAAHKKPERKL